MVTPREEAPLIRGTLWDNLTLGVTNVRRSDVDRAIWACQLEDLVASSPLGLETRVAEWGATLSGGQRQRIALARTVVRSAPVVLLDEVTSQLDPDTESDLLERLLHELRDSTVVMVTHRASAAHRAANVILIENGGVAASGPHALLSDSSVAYRRLFRVAGRSGTANDGREHAR